MNILTIAIFRNYIFLYHFFVAHLYNLAQDTIEEEFCKLTKAKHSIALSSGTAALHLCAIAMSQLNHDTPKRVITTPLTFIGTASAFNRLKESGGLIYFKFCGRVFDLKSRTFFYDWLYVSLLNSSLLDDSLKSPENFLEILEDKYKNKDKDSVLLQGTIRFRESF